MSARFPPFFTKISGSEYLFKKGLAFFGIRSIMICAGFPGGNGVSRSVFHEEFSLNHADDYGKAVEEILNGE